MPVKLDEGLEKLMESSSVKLDVRVAVGDCEMLVLNVEVVVLESEGVSVIHRDGVGDLVVEREMDMDSVVDTLRVEDRDDDNSSVKLGVRLIDMERETVVDDD